MIDSAGKVAHNHSGHEPPTHSVAVPVAVPPQTIQQETSKLLKYFSWD